jgi:hypothetical protein
MWAIHWLIRDNWLASLIYSSTHAAIDALDLAVRLKYTVVIEFNIKLTG